MYACIYINIYIVTGVEINCRYMLDVDACADITYRTGTAVFTDEHATHHHDDRCVINVMLKLTSEAIEMRAS